MKNPNRKKPASLAFIDQYEEKQTEKYTSASFLYSDYDSPSWELDLGDKCNIVINFEMQMPDGARLTDPIYKETLNLFKMWICTADWSSPHKGLYANKATKGKKVKQILNLIDYFILHCDHFSLREHGLSLFNENDRKYLLANLAGNSHISSAIYGWPRRLNNFLSDIIQKTPKSEIENALRTIPYLRENIENTSCLQPSGVEDSSNKVEHITLEHIAECRAALWVNGFYKKCGMSKFRYVPHSRKIIAETLPNTLWGKSHFAFPEYLCLAPIDRRRIEKDRAPTRSKHQHMDLHRLADYASEIDVLKRLTQRSSHAPQSALPELSMKHLVEQFGCAASGRYISVPSNIILNSLKCAISFYLDYGEIIVDAFLAVVAKSKYAPQTLFSLFAGSSIQSFLPAPLKSIGVIYWTNVTAEEKFSTVRKTKSQYFEDFRSNPGLWELLRVLYGAIQFTVGTLQARRESELRSASAETCLSQDLTSLITINRKTGALGINESIERPIPQIASEMIQTLQRLQKKLIALGSLNRLKPIFSHPSVYGGIITISHTSYNASIDYFCDYTQSPCDDHGRRYYFRQHQLRRFFAQIFFWNQEDDSLDVLRWILGHTESEMVYHYITENTPGKVLREIKAEWGTDAIKNSLSGTEELRNYIRKKYDVQDFSIISAEALDTLLDHSLRLGEVLIEPSFIYGPNGSSYKIVATIREIIQ